MPDFIPTRGGDGGTAPKRIAFNSRKPQQHDNRCTRPTGAPDSDLVPTRYAFDRAHFVKGSDGRLLSARQVPNARPRMYPRHAVNAAGMTFEAGFDETERVRRELGGAGIPGFGTAQPDWCVAINTMSDREFEGRTRRKLHERR